MNPLGRGNIGGLSPQMKQQIQQVKSMMKLANGDPTALLSQNPMMNQVMQMCQGKNPEMVFKTMAKNMGIDPDAIMKELRS